MHLQALQPSPHRSFAEEVAFLQMEFDGQPVAIHNEFHMWATAPSSCSTMFEVAMRDLPRDVMAKFYYDFKYVLTAPMDLRFQHDDRGCESWVQDLVPGARVDSQWFEPCGYSCNAFVGKTDRLFTIHITPQPSCSYVSFESNFVDMDMVGSPSALPVRILTNGLDGTRHSVLPSWQADDRYDQWPWHDVGCRGGL